MVKQDFFEEALEQSEVKTAIVSKYFFAWAKVIMGYLKNPKPHPVYGVPERKLAYIDLFAGPGRYLDGTISTPLLVLEKAIADPDLRSMLVSIFNDGDAETAGSLDDALKGLEGIDDLEYPPRVWNYEVGDQIVNLFEETSLIPTFFFVDPWGYKGLSLRLINSVLKDWGSDCIFFFNYNRINMGIRNPKVVEHMNALFGKGRADDLRAELEGLCPAERESAIVEALCASLKGLGGKYVLPFRFVHPTRGSTSHHLIFVSKHVRGYEIMKEIMAKESSEQNQGVPSFEYNPSPDRQGLLFNLSRPLDDLQDLLLRKFAGQTRTMKQVYSLHHVDLPYIKANYKAALVELEEAGRISADPPASGRRRIRGKATCADHVKICFPGVE